MVPGIWYQQLHYQHLNEGFVAVETAGSAIPWHEFHFGNSQTAEKNMLVEGLLFAER
jgi:hypothetical protein